MDIKRMTFEELVAAAANFLYVDSWKSIGDGQCVAEVYIQDPEDGDFVGELYASNGTREEPWAQDVFDFSDRRWINILYLIEHHYPAIWDKMHNPVSSPTSMGTFRR